MQAIIDDAMMRIRGFSAVNHQQRAFIRHQLELVAKAALLRASRFAGAWDFTDDERKRLSIIPGGDYLTEDLRAGRDCACEGIAAGLREMAEEAT